MSGGSVVSYRNSTSNHNGASGLVAASLLYLIEILHQTTTTGNIQRRSKRCILSKFYIKPQHCSTSTCQRKVVSYRNSTSNHNRAPVTNIRIGVVSYRNSTSNHNKQRWKIEAREVVSYRNSTSNHNRRREASWPLRLYLIEILHQTTTPQALMLTGIPLYLIEILHQTTTLSLNQNRRYQLYLIEILHQTTTWLRFLIFRSRLYLIEILHQTTTTDVLKVQEDMLYLIEILHQTTTKTFATRLSNRCILSKFYIKPQLLALV